MKPAPGTLYDNVMPLGGTENPPQFGKDFFHPFLSLSYLLAARHVIDGAERSGRRITEIALPAAYLQRHALEIELKDIIGTARDIAAAEEWLSGPVSAPYENLDHVDPIHDLDELLRQAREALADVITVRIPDAVVKLVADLNKLDDGDPSRFRYSHVKARKGKPDPYGRKWLRSFETETTLDVVATQERMEAVFFEHLAYREDIQGENTFGMSLSRKADGIGQAVSQVEQEAGLV